MDSLIGQSLNRYKIISILGEGGMGAVFKAYDTTLQRVVAIKVMHPHFAGMPNFQERFLQEARSAARLDHPGIVQVHDFGQDRSNLYIVMKFIPGDNLDKLLRELRTKGNWILLDEACGLIEQTANALYYAHRQGVLHRDIKPANIMIEPEPSGNLPYRPVITDLGLAKLAEGGIATQDGSSMGTPAYMSPEQTQGIMTDARSDVYSLGILLFELTTGRLPFPAKNLSEAVHFHVNIAPPKPSEFRADIPQGLEEIILRCLEKDPAKRYPTAGELATALKETRWLYQSIPTAPSSFSSAVSLLAQYQESLNAQLGANYPNDFSENSTGQIYQIQVISENGAARFESIRLPITMIGRDSDNQIVITDRKASRHHARVEFREEQYWIVDLNSTNGTYLNDKRLQPGELELWTSAEDMRIGDTRFRLLIPDQRGQSPQGFDWYQDVSEPDMIQNNSDSGMGPIFLQLENRYLRIIPGTDEAVQLSIQNQGQSVDTFNISISGIEPSWFSLSVSSIRLVPREQKQIAIHFQPPLGPVTRAGIYPVRVRVTSQRDPFDYVETSLEMTIPEFQGFLSSLTPPQLKTGSTGQISIHNQGSFPESYSIRWIDPTTRLAFTPPQPQFNVSGGEEIIAEFRIEDRKKPIFGSQTIQPFDVEIHSGSGEVQAHHAEAIIRSLLPIWLIPIFAVLLLAAAALGVSLITPSGGENNPSAQTLQAANSQVAVVVKMTQDAATAFVTSTQDNYQTTAAAVTATANWLVGDSDNDGLSNQEELAYKTALDNPDSDRDGLEDRVEIFQLHTDPLKADTDGDRVDDGVEIELGLDPLRSDTDGDGIQDGDDPEPLRKPTPTVDIQATEKAAVKATENKAAKQTAAANKATAEAAAQLTSVILQTSNAAQSATQTAQALSHLVYIYVSDEDAANDFQSFFQSKGYRLDLIKQDKILTTDFAKYDVIIIGRDTGSASVWGDDTGILAGMLQSTGRPILGFSEGGYAYFGKIGLQIGWDKGANGTEKDIHVVRSGASYWRQPIPIRIPGNEITSIYDDPEEYVGIFLPTIPIEDVELIANIPAAREYYPLVRQEKRYFLWGFDGTPSAMSTKGTQLLVNVIEALIP